VFCLSNSSPSSGRRVRQRDRSPPRKEKKKRFLPAGKGGGEGGEVNKFFSSSVFFQRGGGGGVGGGGGGGTGFLSRGWVTGSPGRGGAQPQKHPPGRFITGNLGGTKNLSFEGGGGSSVVLGPVFTSKARGPPQTLLGRAESGKKTLVLRGYSGGGPGGGRVFSQQRAGTFGFCRRFRDWGGGSRGGGGGKKNPVGGGGAWTKTQEGGRRKGKGQRGRGNGAEGGLGPFRAARKKTKARAESATGEGEGSPDTKGGGTGGARV